MKMPKTRNCHARNKKKIKALRAKNFWKRVVANRLEKLQKAQRPKGVTIRGKAKKVAIPIKELFPNGDYGFLFATEGKKYPNQRQQRKKWKQNPHLRKAL